MSNQPRRTSMFFLNASIVSARLEERHLTHGDFADELGLSRSYWSQILNRRRPLTAHVRQWLLKSTTLSGLREDDLWERIPVGIAT